ncbi:MAG: hypothetical protein QOJ27_2113 [Sphingomonadales bacterium]|nr:hypothetical protein [Sphingomonadales bacterium]
MTCYLARHGFTHDIFISYAYGPKDGDYAPLKEWSSQFRALLQLNLQLAGINPLAIWFDDNRDRDHGIDALEELDKQFTAEIKASALLQTHVSSFYLGSRWCAQELAKWVEALPAKPGGKERRISIVRVGDTAGEPWPEALAPNGEQLPGHLFHEPATSVPLGINRDWKGRAPCDKFNQMMLDLSSVLRNRLLELEQELDQRAAERNQVRDLLSGNPRSIYLHGRASRRAEWHETRDQLLGLGMEVRPLSPVPDDDEGPAWRKLTHIASRCQAMLLLGADQFELDDDLDVIGRDQRNLIQARFQRYLPCAVVDRKGLRSDAFVNAASIRGIEWLDGTKSDWTDDVPPWIARTAATAARKYGISPEAEGLDPPSPPESLS